MFKAIDIANFFIQLSNSIPGDSIDNLKLNKLLYYAQGRALKTLGHPLFKDTIEAWDFGPVVPNVYHIYKCCGKFPIDDATDTFDEDRLTTDELNILVDVYSYYGKYTGVALANMTHAIGTPWSQVYEKDKNKSIPIDCIRKYFDKHENFDSFSLNCPEGCIITAIPSNWDSDEDSVYDEI